MAVLERSELQASPLADLHAIADQLGLEGFRRLRKADLIDAILGEKEDEGGDSEGPPSDEEPERAPRAVRAPALAARRGDEVLDRPGDFG